ncbi:MAG: hypothetical protein LLG15_11145 [Betaproteobacteria bacterium]|nr:hypothetical protein [Betaproteobacteria bacterium]
MDTVATFVQPNSAPGGQDATNYKGAIDASAKVMSQIAAAFAPHAAATPNMTVLVDAGSFQSNTTRVSQAQQTTPTFTAPTTNPRNDIIVIDQSSGARSVVAGAEAATPADPAIPAGKIAVARVRLTVGMTVITNADIDDLRPAYLIASSLPDVAGHEGHGLHVVGGVFGWSVDKDLVARDQIALTNIQQMLNTAVTTGALAQGKQWELLGDEWATGSSGYTFVLDSINYYSSGQSQSQISGGTNIGNMTAYGGIASAFDGNVSQAYTSAATLAGAGNITGYIGKRWGSNKTVTRFTVYGTTDIGLSNSSNASMTVKLQGSTDNFSSSIVDLYVNSAVTDSNGIVLDVVSGITTTTSYPDHRVSIIENAGDGGSHSISCAEVKFYETVGSTSETLVSPAVTVSTAPNFIDSYFLYKDDSGTSVFGTDFTVEHGRDAGTTFNFATLSIIAQYDGTYSLIRARTDVSGQPSGTSMVSRIKALNNKAQRVAAPSIYSE